jgi:hypothetical protein
VGQIVTADSNATLSSSTLEVLFDLVEIKLGCVEVYDRDDARELKVLQRARIELGRVLFGADDHGNQLVIADKEPGNTGQAVA